MTERHLALPSWWRRVPTAGFSALLWLTASLLPLAVPAEGHDPGAWGGLFRSRDHGETWTSADRAPFVSAVVSLAINPADANDLLLGTDTGLLRTRNGGRDWTVEAPGLVPGAVWGLAFAADGGPPLVSAGRQLFRGDANGGWHAVAAPVGATPAVAVVRGGQPGRVFLASSAGVFHSDDWGTTWSRSSGLPDGSITALVATHGTPETVYAVRRGVIWVSGDGGSEWQRQETPINPAEVEAIALDAWRPERLWAGGNDRLMWSDDGGVEWRLTPRPLPEAHTAVHGIAASGDRIVLTTDRGIYRTVDAGETWVFMTDALPPHLQAGPVAVDLLEPGTLYAGFALVPYAELRQRAVAGGENTHMRDGAAGLAGAAALLAAAALAAVAALRRLWRRDRPGTVIGAGLPRASRKPIPSVLRQ